MRLLYLDNIVYDGILCNNSFFAICVAILDYRRRGRFRRRVRRLSGGHASSCWQLAIQAKSVVRARTKTCLRLTVGPTQYDVVSIEVVHMFSQLHACMTSSNPNFAPQPRKIKIWILNLRIITAVCNNNNNLFPNRIPLPNARRSNQSQWPPQ